MANGEFYRASDHRRRASPSELLALWHHEELRIFARRPADLEEHPDLPLRLRGAMGRVLALAPSSSRLSSDRNAFDDLYGENPVHGTRPMTIDADVAAGLVTIDLRLFGDARVHLDAVRHAMIAALDDGVTLRPRGRRVRFEPIDCLMRRVAPQWPAPIAREAIIRFVTPVVLRSGSEQATSHGALVNALVRRVNGLARWAGINPALDEAKARQLSADLDIQPIETFPVTMRRWSLRAPGQSIPVSGFLGKTRLSGSLELLAPYLVLAETTHIGSHAALGFGRVAVSFY